MEIVFLLIIVSLFFIALLAGALYWAIKSGQFDDMEGHGHEILIDDENVKPDKQDESAN